ncbi:wd repeat-containing protein [Stemphylium lycopersici]|nr:wd repeat-containing protein [Stemphylium lycopersici]RAR08309.1 wd repeat-containing protein [Stemphylium lycopersici]
MAATVGGPLSAFESPTFDRDVEIKVDDEIGAASISPAGRDIVLASKNGLRIIDLDNLFSLPLFIPNQSSWDVADVQWSPFAARAEWIATTRNQLALVYNLSMPYNNKKAPIEYTLRAHDRAITDINFSAHHPDLLATCGVDSFVFVHDLRSRQAPLKLADYTAGATQVKWNRQNDKIIASAHDKHLHIWDVRHGATPLSTIAAHSTKIYGIDWNRNDPSKIMTCSLDATIKLWNNVGISDNITVPRRVIRTHYPVWRARHTPFPHGILAMPQRGNSNLWLYKHVNDSDPATFNNDPVHAFQKHDSDAQVREFLWRTRGSTDHAIDNRDFQLISWGTDKRLQLHRLEPDLLEKTVGYRKGDSLIEEPSATRRGATYVSYRDGPIPTTTAASRDQFGPPRQQRKGNLSTLLQNYSLNEEVYTSRRGGETHPRIHAETVPRETMTAQPIRRNDPRVVNHITWINGVKFGGDRHNNVNDFHARPNGYDRVEKYPYQEQNDLGAEISYVGNKYKKLAFEQIDVPGRRIKVSFNGPWGDYDPATESAKLVFLRFTIKFPPAYPKAIEGSQSGSMRHRIPTPLEIEFERTTASISREHQEELIHNMHHIAATCADQEREALEAVLSYSLGERALDDSLDLAEDVEPLEDLGPLPGESSSEDEDQDGEFTDDVMQSSHTNANIPLPIQCTARFSADGSLVVARIPPVKSTPGSEVFRFQIARSLRQSGLKNDIFDSFGRFTSHRPDDSDGASSPSSSVGSWETSSTPSSSSGSEHMANGHIGNFQPPLAWQKSASRFQSRNSLPSSGGVAKQSSKAKSTVSILFSATDDLVPSKRVLAEGYRIFGPGPMICEHNSGVARKHGHEDLADIWMLCKLILSNEVPLDILPQHYRRDQVLVLARRALVRIKRKDSGLDLQFDEADNVSNPRLNARVKWGHHTVVTWLIPSLFDHFERLADVQMLAMLSCIFAEPAAREGVTSAMAKMRQSQLPMSMEAPAFSLDYFSSPDAAWSLFKPTISVPSTPSHVRSAVPSNEFGWQRLAKNLDTYGSHGSSNGPWGSDTFNSDPVTPHSTGNTPPVLSRATTIRSAKTADHTPYGTSPEQSHTAHKKSSTANFASAVAALSRPFANAMSSSPPVRSRIEDLSTSAPTSGVTWGTTTFYGSDSYDQSSMAPPHSKHGKRASFGQSEQVDVNYIGDSDSDYEKVDDDGSYTMAGSKERTAPGTPRDGDGGFTVKVTLKNQDQFDDEACFSRPLLDASKDWLHRAWREQYAEMLNRWGLISVRAEVLKFNGLVSYFPTETSRTSSKSGSISLTLKRSEDEEEEGKSNRHVSRASSTLVPPTPTTTQLKRLSVTSPQHFSFNPEATEFQPGTFADALPEEQVADVPTDASVPTEQYLRLSIPAPTPTKELDESLAGLGTSPSQSRLQPPPSRAGRPSLSRGTSNVSGSSWRDGRSRLTPTTAPPKSVISDPIYSCSICWIRVCGLFYLCPACGHVAHMDCMDDEVGMNDGECVVGCGCGCGLEDDDERSRMEAYIEGVRAAQAAGTAWEEGSVWLPSGTTTPALYPESAYGDFMTGGTSKMTGASAGEEKKKERGAGGGGRRDVVSPTPTKAKKKGKKKPRASGLSYY